jgi:hypothetical protein
MLKKLMALVLSLALLLTTLAVPVGAVVGGEVTKTVSQFSDMPDDWSTIALQNAVKNGLLQGDGDKILPAQNLTRAQMATVINRAFGAQVKAQIDNFTDVEPKEWYYEEMAKAVMMKTFQGSGNQLNPNSSITREEAFIVLARALKLGKSVAVAGEFTDLGQISSWAKEEVYSMINAGYVQGSNGKINPKATITRAEFAQLMDNIIKVYINEAGEYTEVADGNVMINAPGVTLKNITVNGDLIIGDGVGDGEVELDNVNVTGRLVVRGGGANSIVIKGSSQIGNVIIARVDGTVRVFAESGAEIEVIHIEDGSDEVIIEGSVGTLEIKSEVPVTIKNATIETVKVEALQANVTVDLGTNVKNVVVEKVSEGTKLTVEGTVDKVTTEASKTEVKGTGTVKAAEVKAGANDSKIETPSTKVSVSEGVSGTTGTGGAELEAGKDYENAEDTTQVSTPIEEPVSGGGGGGGTTVTSSTYAFVIEKGANAYNIGEKTYADNTNLSFAMISTIFDENIGSYPEAVDEYAGFFERALEKTHTSGHPYAYSLANRINSYSGALGAFTGAAVDTLVDDIIAEGNATPTQVREFAEIMANASLEDLVDDLALLYPNETTPTGFEFTIYGESGTSENLVISDLKATFESKYSSKTISQVSGQILIALTQGSESIEFLIEKK